MGDQTSLLGGGALGPKEEFSKKNLIMHIISQWGAARACAHARARVGRNSGTVTPIDLKFSGIIKTPKLA